MQNQQALGLVTGRRTMLSDDASIRLLLRQLDSRCQGGAHHEKIQAKLFTNGASHVNLGPQGINEIQLDNLLILTIFFDCTSYKKQTFAKSFFSLHEYKRCLINFSVAVMVSDLICPHLMHLQLLQSVKNDVLFFVRFSPACHTFFRPFYNIYTYRMPHSFRRCWTPLLSAIAMCSMEQGSPSLFGGGAFRHGMGGARTRRLLRLRERLDTRLLGA